MTTGLPSGVAPPARPVPLPRATERAVVARGHGNRRRDLLGRLGEADDRGLASLVAGVA